MATRIRIDPLELELSVLFPEDFSAEARSRQLAKTAREQLDEAQQTNARALGRIPPHETYVDGRRGGSIDAVKPDGQVVFEFELLEDVFTFIGEMLIVHSPVGQFDDPRPDHPELFARSHILTADETLVDLSGPIPQAREYVFVNTQPYARKIERGLSRQAPDGVYDVVAALANARFGNIAKIRFSYRTPIIGAINAWAAGTQMASPYRRGAKRAEWLRRQPAIVITPRGA